LFHFNGCRLRSNSNPSKEIRLSTSRADRPSERHRYRTAPKSRPQRLDGRFQQRQEARVTEARPRRGGADSELRTVQPQTPLRAKTPDGGASAPRLRAAKATGAKANRFASHRRSCGIDRTNRLVLTTRQEDTRRRAIVGLQPARREWHPAIQLHEPAAARIIRPRPAIPAAVATVVAAVAADIIADELLRPGALRWLRSTSPERAEQEGSGACLGRLARSTQRCL
jgi:hypothetical protein